MAVPMLSLLFFCPAKKNVAQDFMNTWQVLIIFAWKCKECSSSIVASWLGREGRNLLSCVSTNSNNEHGESFYSLFWTTRCWTKQEPLAIVSSYHPSSGDICADISLHLIGLSEHLIGPTVKCLHRSITHSIWKRTSVQYLLCCFYGKKLVLAFSSTNIAKGTIICYIPSNEGDFVYWMLMLYDLELEKKQTQKTNPIGLNCGI